MLPRRHAHRSLALLTVGVAVGLGLTFVEAFIDQNRIDAVTPLAPALARPGPHAVGVRTVTVTDPGRVDVLATTPGGPTMRHDRSLTLEVWYPASLAAGQTPGTEYRTISRDPSIAVTLRGRAVRDAMVAAGGPFPLVVVSHGYPGNRFLMSHLGEHLATHGYAVASIDHADSTYDRQLAFSSTLYNRALDQLFVVRALATLGARGSGHALAGTLDATRTAVVGYSMGGYGAINAAGGGYRSAAATFAAAPPNELLRERVDGDPRFEASRDARIAAVVAIGPWGMQAGYWDAAGLSRITTPLLFVAGSVDEVSGYGTGTRALFEHTTGADRYLLTYLNAAHNAGAPIPPPVETAAGPTGRGSPFLHYADPVWDSVRMNNILQHFVTAFVDVHLKRDIDKRQYLDVTTPRGEDGVFALDASGAPQSTHTYWKGFLRGTAIGLVLEHATGRAP